MRPFDYINAHTISEAEALLANENSVAIAGGTDLLCTLKDDILFRYPDLVIGLKSILGLDEIHVEGDKLVIGALTRISEISNNTIVRDVFPALGTAANSVASPNLRNMATIAGNLCQLPRCWYFRKAGNRFPCKRKGGELCFAVEGDNRYHSIFGGKAGCIAVNVSDLAPALIIYDAEIITNKRVIRIEDLFDSRVIKTTVLDQNEIVTHVRIPFPSTESRTVFKKFAFRKAIDFPVVNCAINIGRKKSRICIGAVAPIPYRALAAEEMLNNVDLDSINSKIVEEISVATTNSARASQHADYKVQITQVLAKRCLLELTNHHY